MITFLNHFVPNALDVPLPLTLKIIPPQPNSVLTVSTVSFSYLPVTHLPPHNPLFPKDGQEEGATPESFAQCSDNYIPRNYLSLHTSYLHRWSPPPQTDRL